MIKRYEQFKCKRVVVTASGQFEGERYNIGLSGIVVALYSRALFEVSDLIVLSCDNKRQIVCPLDVLKLSD